MGVAVDDQLPRQCLSALGRRLGCRGLGHADLEEPAEHLVHRDERGRHAGGSLEEAPARQALVAGEPVAQILEPGLDLALLGALPDRHVLVARHDLRRHRRRKRRRLGRLQFAQFAPQSEISWGASRRQE